MTSGTGLWLVVDPVDFIGNEKLRAKGGVERTDTALGTHSTRNDLRHPKRYKRRQVAAESERIPMMFSMTRI